MTVDTLDRFRGALLGCAVGDALGAPLEGMSRGAIAEMHGEVTDYLDARFGRGRITDDTQMTVALAQSITEIGRFEVTHTAFKFARWIEASDSGVKEARGVGMACAVACRRLASGAGPEESAVESAGCGSAMRAGPVGLRYCDDPAGLFDASLRQSGITHRHPEAAAGAAAIAMAVALGVRDGGDLDRAGFIRELAQFVERADRGMSSRIAGLADYLDASPEEGFAYTGVGGYVMQTVPAALFAFIRTPYDFRSTVVTAVNAGGDTDSIGAMAGAVSGAFNGERAIPAGWKEGVEGADYLRSLAFRLHTLTPAGKPERRPLVPGFGT